MFGKPSDWWLEEYERHSEVIERIEKVQNFLAYRGKWSVSLSKLYAYHVKKIEELTERED